jgi:hypothetical protein
MKDRLIELLDIIIQPGEKTMGDIADYLLSNGVIVPPCKVGDTVYFLCRDQETYEWYICEKEVYSITVYDNSTHIYVSPICSFIEMEIGYRLFLTREEAEKALKERSEGE